MDIIKPVSYQKLIKIFEKAGCVYSHTRGDHLIFHHKNGIRPIVITKYNEIPVFIIKNNLRIINLSKEEYLKIYNEV